MYDGNGRETVRDGAQAQSASVFADQVPEDDEFRTAVSGKRESGRRRLPVFKRN